MPRTRARGAHEKTDALRLAAEVGVAEAARRLGVPPGTIYAWRSRAGQAGAPAGMDPRSWAARKQRGAEDAWKAAQQALKKVHELLEAGKTGDAQRASLAFAILTDKSGVLEAGAAAARIQDVKLTSEQARVLADVLQNIFRDLGLGTLLQPGTPGAAVVRHHLERASGPAPTTDAARQSLRAALQQELEQAPMRQELPPIRGEAGCSTQKLHVESEPKPDMAPTCDVHRHRGSDEQIAGDGESGSDRDQYLDPVEPDGDGVARTVELNGDRDLDLEPVEEVVDAEVVDEPPIPQLWLDAYHGDQRAARGAFDRARARELERERREAERPSSLITTRPSVHHLDGPRFGPPGGGV